MNKKEMAQFLEVSVKALEKYMAQGKIAFVYVEGKFGKQVEFALEEGERFKKELANRPAIISPNLVRTENQHLSPTPTLDKSIVNSTEEIISVLKDIAEGLNRENKHLMFPVNEKLVFTLDEASSFSGISVRVIRKAIKLGQLKGLKISRSLQVKREDLETWVKGL